MTPLNPVSEHEVRVPSLPPAAPPRQKTCGTPGCRNRAEQRHHIVPRGTLKGAFDWILICGDLACNVVDLCSRHHSDIESRPGGCRARIRWLGSAGWGWYNRGEQVDITKAAIWWFDPKTDSAWKFRGFLREDYWVVR